MLTKARYITAPTRPDLSLLSRRPIMRSYPDDSESNVSRLHRGAQSRSSSTTIQRQAPPPGFGGQPPSVLPSGPGSRFRLSHRDQPGMPLTTAPSSAAPGFANPGRSVVPSTNGTQDHGHIPSQASYAAHRTLSSPYSSDHTYTFDIPAQTAMVDRLLEENGRPRRPPTPPEPKNSVQASKTALRTPGNSASSAGSGLTAMHTAVRSDVGMQHESFATPVARGSSGPRGHIFHVPEPPDSDEGGAPLQQRRTFDQ
jgi:hypothetical protein